ncbi:MAG: hypothetical protein CL521_01740 [Actinobacteria bacterium]|nr:hypothetical protein [Actinomycetota bacterium]
MKLIKYILLSLLLLLAGIMAQRFYLQFVTSDILSRPPSLWGTYLNNDQGMASDLITDSQKQGAIYAWHLDWSFPFPSNKVQTLIQNQQLPMIVWEPRIWEDTEPIELSEILNGDWDHHLRQWAQRAAQFEYPLLIAWAPFFNHARFPWSQSHQSSSLYRRTYQYIIDAFRSEGAHNALWVYLLQETPYPFNLNQHYLDAFPGPAYIDWLALNLDKPLPQDLTQLEKRMTQRSLQWQQLQDQLPVMALSVPSNIPIDGLGALLNSSMQHIQGVLFQDLPSSIALISESPYLSHDSDRIQSVMPIMDTSPSVNLNVLDTRTPFSVKSTQNIRQGVHYWSGPDQSSFSGDLEIKGASLMITLNVTQSPLSPTLLNNHQLFKSDHLHISVWNGQADPLFQFWIAYHPDKPKQWVHSIFETYPNALLTQTTTKAGYQLTFSYPLRFFPPNCDLQLRLVNHRNSQDHPSILEQRFSLYRDE